MMDCSGLRLALFTDTYAPQMNGVARTLERLADAVRERGGAIQTHTVADPAELTREEGVVRYPARPFNAYPELQLAWPALRNVLKELNDFKPTLIHSATEFGVGIAGRRAAGSLRVPFVSSYHTNFSEYAQHYKMGVLAKPGWQYMRWFHNGGLRTYVPTHAIKSQVQEQGFRNVNVWSRGVDTKKFSPSHRSDELRNSIGIVGDKLVVLYVGRVAPEKGIDIAVEAMHLVEKQRPGMALFACVGDGPSYASVKASVQKSSLASSWLPGRLQGAELSRAYASSDIFVFPSTTDTFGNVQLEAMASGLAVVGADVPATREIVGKDRGLLATPNSSESFAAAIVALIDDRYRLIQCQEAALRFAMTSTWESVWDTLISDYLTVHDATKVQLSAT